MTFFQKARDRAQEAMSSAQGHIGASGGGGHQQQASSDSTTGEKEKKGFSYTGVIPHAIRSGIASIDPRYESTRSFHLLSGALKSISIDNDALARETKAAAKATYNWGQDHIPSKRQDGAGDDVLVDVTDRLAYILSELAELTSAHVKRSEIARAEFKDVGKAEKELYPRRQKRAQIHRELAALVPERAAKASANDKVIALEQQLKTLEQEDKGDEESLGRLKREGLHDAFQAHFDSLIELGEKIALVARYGKLLTQEIPTGESPTFPAPQVHRSAMEPSWVGAVRTAEIRAAVGPALKAYVPIGKLPELTNAPGSSDASTLGRADTASYGVTHREELEDPGSGNDNWRASMEEGGDDENDRAGALPALPVPATNSGSGHDLSSRINMSPAAIPAPSPPLGRQPSISEASQPSTVHRVPPLPQDDLRSPLPADASIPATPSKPNVSPNPSANIAASSSADEPPFHEGSAPPELTVAETGAPIVGPGGPSSGTLERRPSATTRMPMPPPPPLRAGATPASPPVAGSGAVPAPGETPTLSARVAKVAEAEREAAEVRDAAARARTEAHARLRRDGTVVRRGEPDWEAAVEEDLPAYEEQEGGKSGA